MPRRKRVHPDALLLTYRQGRWYNEGPGEMEMNIKFEWIEGTDDVDCSLWLGRVNIGSVTERGGKHVAWFGHEHHALGGGFPTLDEAKAWVEGRARAWLAEVTA